MADPITREQVERAMDVPQPDPLAYADSPVWDDGPMLARPVPEAVPQPEPWHARLVRLAQEERAASKACSNQARGPWWDARDIEILESRTQCDGAFTETRARYAAALSAEEQRRAAKPEPVRFQLGDLVRVVNCNGSPDNGREFIVHKVVGSTVYETPDHSWTPYTLELVRAAEQPEPAPEVVDVPQPEPWYARLVRLAQEERDASKACAEAEDAFKVADAEREKVRKVRAAAREACDVARKALTAATTAAAIVEAAQQPAPAAEPTRLEPRYKVGDWVRVVTGPNSAGRTTPIRVTCVTSAGYIMADGASWAAVALTPALDPALHETARRTVAILRKSTYERLPDGASKLPMFKEWNNGPVSTREWAAQLERLLGDAP